MTAIVRWTSPNPEPFRPFPHPLFVRPGTMDGDTLQSACIEDEYGLTGRVRPGDTVVDCGGYVGGFSALALSFGCYVSTIEPLQSNCDMIGANTKTWAPRLTLFRGALSARKGQIPLHTTAELGNVHRFMANTIAADDLGDVVEMTPACSLNMLLDPLSHVRFLKMDVEGAEYEALAGLSPENLAKIDRIAIEVHPPEGVGQEEAFARIAALLPNLRPERTNAMDAWFQR